MLHFPFPRYSDIPHLLTTNHNESSISSIWCMSSRQSRCFGHIFLHNCDNLAGWHLDMHTMTKSALITWISKNALRCALLYGHNAISEFVRWQQHIFSISVSILNSLIKLNAENSKLFHIPPTTIHRQHVKALYAIEYIFMQNKNKETNVATGLFCRSSQYRYAESYDSALS